MKKAILTVVLSIGLIGSASATAEKMPVVTGSGGFSNLSGGSQFVAGAAVALVVAYAIQQNKYTCTISKTAPKPGTNYTNEKSTCVVK